MGCAWTGKDKKEQAVATQGCKLHATPKFMLVTEFIANRSLNMVSGVLRGPWVKGTAVYYSRCFLVATSCNI